MALYRYGISRCDVSPKERFGWAGRPELIRSKIGEYPEARRVIAFCLDSLADYPYIFAFSIPGGAGKEIEKKTLGIGITKRGFLCF